MSQRTLTINIGLLVCTVATLICLARGSAEAAIVWALLAIAMARS